MHKYDYFDAAYFNEGRSKGTVYWNYVEVSRSARSYIEIAQAIRTVFAPQRVLEIGCATGLIVRYLNEQGLEAHGIDVSEWAVEHREHANVILAGAEQLPYPEGYFDLVYSVHALEHIPRPLAPAAFREMKRVCPTGPQWHMLPVVGMGPYQGEREIVIERLMSDPTHNLLEDQDWWLRQFDDVGLKDTGAAVYLESEHDTLDLSHSHHVVAGSDLSRETRARLREWNAGILKRHFDRTRRGAFFLTFAGNWTDAEFDVPEFTLSKDTEIRIDVLSSQATSFRIALIGGKDVAARECDKWLDVPQGRREFFIRRDDLELRSGDLEGFINRIRVGGSGTGTIAFDVAISISGRQVYTLIRS